MRFMAAAVIAIIFTAPLAAADAPTKDAKPKKEKRICRESEPTGSRLIVRTCRTEAEWAEVDRQQSLAAKEELSRQQTMSRSGGSGFSAN